MTTYYEPSPRHELTDAELGEIKSKLVDLYIGGHQPTAAQREAVLAGLTPDELVRLRYVGVGQTQPTPPDRND